MPGTGVTPGPVKVKVVGVMVEEAIPLSKAATTVWLVATALAEFAGLVELTSGGVASGPLPVVKLKVYSAARV